MNANLLWKTVKVPSGTLFLFIKHLNNFSFLGWKRGVCLQIERLAVDDEYVSLKVFFFSSVNLKSFVKMQKPWPFFPHFWRLWNNLRLPFLMRDFLFFLEFKKETLISASGTLNMYQLYITKINGFLVVNSSFPRICSLSVMALHCNVGSL